MSSETPFELDGDLILIDALVEGPRARASIKLILDTGAALTTIAPSIAEAIGYRAGLKRTVTRTATAEEHGYLIQLQALHTLGTLTRSAYANVADLGDGVDGVLGMSFLLDYVFEIHPSRQRIRIEKLA